MKNWENNLQLGFKTLLKHCKDLTDLFIHGQMFLSFLINSLEIRMNSFLKDCLLLETYKRTCIRNEKVDLSSMHVQSYYDSLLEASYNAFLSLQKRK